MACCGWMEGGVAQWTTTGYTQDVRSTAYARYPSNLQRSATAPDTMVAAVAANCTKIGIIRMSCHVMSCTVTGVRVHLRNRLNSTGNAQFDIFTWELRTYRKLEEPPEPLTLGEVVKSKSVPANEVVAVVLPAVREPIADEVEAYCAKAGI